MNQTPKKMSISPDDLDILARCRELTEHVESCEPPPRWRSADFQAYADEVAFGPRYRAGEWWGEISNADRQGFLRSIHRLADGGFLELTRNANRLSHVRLTDLGKEALAGGAGEDEGAVSADRLLILSKMRELVASSEDPRIQISAARLLLVADQATRRPPYQPSADAEETDGDAAGDEPATINGKPNDAKLESLLTEAAAASIEADTLIDELRQETPADGASADPIPPKRGLKRFVGSYADWKRAKFGGPAK